MLSAQGVSWFLQCCSCRNQDGTGTGELQVQLSSDHTDGMQRRFFPSADSFDITFTPRATDAESEAEVAKAPQLTPRQKCLKDELELPMLHQYPVPPSCGSDDNDETRLQVLLRTYQEFALDMHKGMYLTQLTSSRDYSDIHCQLMEDLLTLKLDQSNGRIIEFPLTGVSKVYRVVKNDGKWYSAGSLNGPQPVPPLPLSNAEHIVVVEFMKRKLAFVFKDIQASQRFLMCMELLIRRAQQKQAGKALRPLAPNFPSANSAQGPGKSCGTPRQVHDAVSRGNPCFASPVTCED